MEKLKGDLPLTYWIREERNNKYKYVKHQTYLLSYKDQVYQI